jgi:hypothetical protein
VDPSGYPLIYCPPGVQRPSHCPHLGAVGIKAPASGPDGKAGQTYGGPYLPAQRPMWSETKHGWWVKLAGYQPQHLIRMDVSPRIVRFHLVEGADKDQWWQVPVLLRPVDDKHHNRGFMSALDRVLGPDGFTARPSSRSCSATCSPSRAASASRRTSRSETRSSTTWCCGSCSRRTTSATAR